MTAPAPTPEPVRRKWWTNWRTSISTLIAILLAIIFVRLVWFILLLTLKQPFAFGLFIIAITYVVCLSPIIWLLTKATIKLSESRQFGQVLQGVATGALLAVLASLLLTRGIGVQGGVLAWLAFVTACGVSMFLPTPLRGEHVFIASAVPSLVLLGAALAIYTIPQFLGQMMCAVISAGPELEKACLVSPPGVMGLTLFVTLVSIPGIAAGIYARTQVISFVKLAVRIDPKKVSRVEKLVNAALRICAVLGAAFVVLR